MSGLTACGCASRSTRPSSAASGHGRATRPGCSPSSHGEGEVSNVAPGFSEDPVVVVNDPLTFARWHPGLIDWAAAVRADTPQVSAPPELVAQPAWNADQPNRSETISKHSCAVTRVEDRRQHQRITSTPRSPATRNFALEHSV